MFLLPPAARYGEGYVFTLCVCPQGGGVPSGSKSGVSSGATSGGGGVFPKKKLNFFFSKLFFAKIFS